MKKILITLLLCAALLLILNACANQNQATNNIQENPSLQTKNDSSDIKAKEDQSIDASDDSNLDINKEDLDKLKTDINNLDFSGPNGLSQ